MVDQQPLGKDDLVLTDYKFDATVTADANHSATTEVTLQHRQSGERALLLHLDANLCVSSVKDAGGHTLPFFQSRAYGNNIRSHGDYLVVGLSQPTVTGATATLTFLYADSHLIRKVGAGNYFCLSYGWYPALPDSFATRANFDLAFHSPRKFILAATGQEVGNSIRVFDEFFGPYPFAKLSVTNIPYSYGQGWPTLLYISALSFLDPTQRHVLGIPDDYRISDFFRAHETSHQWWGQLIGWKTYHDQWLSEGFAQFSGNLYVEFRENPGQFLNRLKQDKQELLDKDGYGRVYDSLGPIWMGQRLSSDRTPDCYARVIYDKGGLVLNTLRMMLMDPHVRDPDAAFIAMMHDYVQTFAGKAASTEDFESIVNKHMTAAMDIDHNHKMDWFFDEYVYGTGVPVYTLSYQIADQIADVGNGR